VQQKGSQVDPDKTRFDFAHTAPMSAEEIREVEEIVNNEILANAATETRLMAIAEAQKSGAMMLFGEKYGDEVRVVGIGSSTELCGGTHVGRTGDIGLFKILGETGVAAGVRRVEAVTGGNALRYVQALEMELDEVSFELGFHSGSGDLMVQKVRALQEQLRAERKELARLKAKLASGQGDDLAMQAVDVKGIKVLAATMEGADMSALRDTMDKLKDKLQSAVVVLASVADGKVSLIAGVTSGLTAKVKAGELVNMVAVQVGGKGGGRPDMAQAGGTDASQLPAALASVSGWVESRL
jgi:alanyl-tRNA synthetase